MRVLTEEEILGYIRYNQLKIINLAKKYPLGFLVDTSMIPSNVRKVVIVMSNFSGFKGELPTNILFLSVRNNPISTLPQLPISLDTLIIEGTEISDLSTVNDFAPWKMSTRMTKLPKGCQGAFHGRRQVERLLKNLAISKLESHL